MKLYQTKNRKPLSDLLLKMQNAPVITGYVKTAEFNINDVCNVVDNADNLWFITTTDADIDDASISGRTNLLFSNSASEEMDIVSVYGQAKVTSIIPSTIFAGNRKFKSWMKNNIGKKLYAIKVDLDEVCFWDKETFAYETLFKLESTTIRTLDTETSDQVAALSA